MLKVKKKRGVLGKDKTPYAPETINYVQGEWMSPARYDVKTLCVLLNLLAIGEIKSIEVIDTNNTQFTITNETEETK